jgi:hypothetical protein
MLTHSGATIDIAIWSTTEQGLAITAGSLATLRPLFRLISGKVSSLYGNRSTNLRASDHKQHPPTIGAGESNRQQNRPHGPFSLLSTRGGDDEAALHHREESGKDIEMPQWSIEKKTSVWTSTRDGSSEEDLAPVVKPWEQGQRTTTVCESEHR